MSTLLPLPPRKLATLVPLSTLAASLDGLAGQTTSRVAAEWTSSTTLTAWDAGQVESTVSLATVSVTLTTPVTLTTLVTPTTLPTLMASADVFAGDSLAADALARLQTC